MRRATASGSSPTVRGTTGDGMGRYEALLTVRQCELITLCEERAVTIPALFEELRQLNLDFNMPTISRESIYMSMRFLLYRGLVIRDDGHWPYLWMATDEGLDARDAAEKCEALTPRRVILA